MEERESDDVLGFLIVIGVLALVFFSAIGVAFKRWLVDPVPERR